MNESEINKTSTSEIIQNSPDIYDSFIDIFGPLTPDISLKNLQIITERFALIPYENITKIIQAAHINDPIKRLRLPNRILDDFKLWHTGGTCFSLTQCLKTILDSAGFYCSIRMADLGSRTNNHCALVVDLNQQKYLIDPGYLITTPLPIPESNSVIHPTRLYPVRLERNRMDGSCYISTLEPNGEKYRYRLHPDECNSEIFITYWIDSFHWNMMHSILITKALSHGRFYLHDRYLRYFNREGKQGEKVKENYDQTIAQHSGINIQLIKQARQFLAQSKANLKED